MPLLRKKKTTPPGAAASFTLEDIQAARRSYEGAGHFEPKHLNTVPSGAKLIDPASGQMQPINDAALKAICHNIAERFGYTLTGASITLYGTPATIEKEKTSV